MQTIIPFISKNNGPQVVGKAALLCEGRYPGLMLSLEAPGSGCWVIHASGPGGNYTLHSPSPLHGEYLTALCEKACARIQGESDV